MQLKHEIVHCTLYYEVDNDLCSPVFLYIPFPRGRPKTILWAGGGGCKTTFCRQNIVASAWFKASRSAFLSDLKCHLKRQFLRLGRRLLGQKLPRNPFSWHPSGQHLVCGLFERHIGTLLPKKVPKQKTCPITRKRMICDYLLLN